MKRLLMVLFCASTMVAGIARDHAVSCDTVWGAYCYRELRGQISGVSRQNTPFCTTGLKRGEEMVYFVLADKSEATISLAAAGSKANTTLHIKIAEVNTGMTLCNKTVKTRNDSGERPLTVARHVKLPSKSWYRISIAAADWTLVKSIDYILIDSDSPIGAKPSPIFMAPSVHLTGWESTDPGAPKGEAYDWAYMEVMLPEQYERKNTYVMSLGVLSGYMGIQTVDDEGFGNYKHRVIFSMWDKGDTDADTNLPDYLCSGALDRGYDVLTRRFGGEGTGTQAIIMDSHWRSGHWVQFITTCRPEKIELTLKGCHGQDSTAEYTNTLVSAWYKEADEKEWNYLATLREAGRNHYMAGWYSFLENFTDDGGEFYRRAYYRNGYLHSLVDGKWYNRNKVDFGHTQGKPQEPRYDYGHGATKLYPNCFYLEQGGYSLNANDSAQITPLSTDNTPVDTIDINTLWGRMEQAIRKESRLHMDLMIAQAAERNDKLDAFKALAKRFIDNAGKFGYYSAEDMTDLTICYNGGHTDDAAGLAQELHFLAHTANALKYAQVAKVEHLGCTHGYQIITAKGAAMANDNYTLAFATDSIATDNGRNWRFVRQGDSNRFIIRNIGTGLYLDPDSPKGVSSKPAQIAVTKLDSDGNFAISAGNKHIECQLIDNYFVK